MRKADAFVPRHMPSAGRNKNHAFSLFRDIEQSHLGFFEVPQSLSQHRTVIIIYHIKTNMKLFTALFLAISAHNQSPANAVELPNLRGVVGIALTDGETSGESGRSGYGPHGAPPCRKKTEQCSTSTTTSAQFQCCDVGQLETTQKLTCNPADISNPHYDGICGVAASASGEDTARSSVAPYRKNGKACVGSVDDPCSTAQDAKHQHKCCNSASMDLTCAKNDTVTSSTFDGKCVDASGDVCHDFAQMKINCDADLDPNIKKDVTKCTSHWAYPDADAHCHFICQWHFKRQEHICVLGGGEDEENQ